MMEFKIDDDGMYLNYKEISESDWLLPTIRLLAIDLQKCSYISIGDWFKGLSDRSFDELMDLADHVADGYEDEYMEQTMLLTLMLAHAEGTADMKSLETIRKQMGTMLQLITFESLYRKGLVRVYREHYTLGDDMGDKIVVEKL